MEKICENTCWTVDFLAAKILPSFCLWVPLRFSCNFSISMLKIHMSTYKYPFIFAHPDIFSVKSVVCKNYLSQKFSFFLWFLTNFRKLLKVSQKLAWDENFWVQNFHHLIKFYDFYWQTLPEAISLVGEYLYPRFKISTFASFTFYISIIVWQSFMKLVVLLWKLMTAK